MKTKPVQFSAYAMVCLLVCFSVPLHILLTNSAFANPFQLARPFDFFVAKLQPFHWALIAAALASSYSVWRASVVTVFAVPVLTALVTYNNWTLLSHAMQYSAVILISTMLFIATTICFFVLPAREVLFNPELRWWLRAKRHRKPYPVRVQFAGPDGPQVITETFDISETGAFVPAGQLLRSKLKPDIGTPCVVVLKIEGVGEFQFHGEVARCAEGTGTYPAGIGLRFVDVPRLRQQTLAAALQGSA